MNSFQKYQYKKQKQSHKEKFNRILEKYKEAVTNEERYASNIAIAPQSAMLERVDYIYVIFKNNEIPE